ncbi:unnamed protein product [Rotaria sordida]|uniref:Uncharacterized protein n=1 Tax=Rotaria sordida TaxID=392033 RepID=A0A815NP68_9BILA|nr:unnamed protein product [Rotaria sordida]
MTFTNAQKQKRYRENLKAKGLYQITKAKHTVRMRIYRQNLTGTKKQDYDKKHAESQRAYRNKNKKPKNSFLSKQSFGKALKKAKCALPKDFNKKKVIARALAQAVGIVPRNNHQRTTRQLSSKIKNSIILFYGRDDISYQMPGKRDTIIVNDNGNKTTYQKKILLYTIREAYELFLAENPGISVGRTAFAEIRPKHISVKSSMAHRVCICIYHENVNLLLNSLSKHVNGSFCSNLYSFTSALVCDESNCDCMSSNCFTCQNYFDLNIKNNVIDKHVQIKWYQWKNINGYATKEEQQGSVEQGIELLSSKVKTFLLHVYIKRQQSKFFEESKTNTDNKKIVIQVDYSENFEIKQQDEVQSAHWSSKSVSIFTAYAWCGTNNYSFALVSNNISHDKYCVYNCITYIINKLKQQLPSLEEILFFSDGAASQFKQRYLMRNLTRMSYEYQLILSWHFFATSHAKGVVDAIGGSVKRIVWQQILTKKDKCENATDFINIAKTKTKAIIIDEITQEDIDKSKAQLQAFFSNTLSVQISKLIFHIENPNCPL